MKFIRQLASLLLMSTLPAALSAATIRGKVLDQLGDPIDAYVFVYDNSSHPRINGPLPGVATIADKNGHFNLELAPGFYDVCTFATGFTALCRKVRVNSPADSVSETFKMKIDPSSAGKEFQ